MPISKEKIIDIDGKKAVFISPQDPELGGLCIFGHQYGNRSLGHNFPHLSDGSEYISPTPHHAFWAEFAYKCLSFLKENDGNINEQKALKEFLILLPRIPQDKGVLTPDAALNLFVSVFKKHSCKEDKYVEILSNTKNDIRRQIYEKVYQKLFATYEDLADIANQAYDANIHLYAGYVSDTVEDYSSLSDYIIRKFASNNQEHKLSRSYIQESREIFERRREFLKAKEGDIEGQSDPESGLKELEALSRRLGARGKQRKEHDIDTEHLQADLSGKGAYIEPDSALGKLAKLRESLSRPAPRRGMQVNAKKKIKSFDDIEALRERLLEKRPTVVRSSELSGEARRIDDFYVTSINVSKRAWSRAQRAIVDHVGGVKAKINRGLTLADNDLVSIGGDDPDVVKRFYDSIDVASSENSLVISGSSEQGVIKSDFSLTIEYDRNEKEIVQQLSGSIEPSDCELLLAMQMQAKIALETRKREFIIDGNVELETIIKCIQISNCIGLIPELEGSAKMIVLESFQRTNILQENIEQEYLKLLQSKGPYEQNNKIMSMSIEDRMSEHQSKKSLQFR